LPCRSGLWLGVIPLTESQDDWKARYKGLARENERLQHDLSEQQKRIRSLSGQLVVGLRGRNSALDADLDQLHQLLKNKQGGEGLDKVYRDIEKHVRRLDAQHQSVARDIRVAIERWLAQLRDLSHSESFSNLLKNVERRLPDTSEHLYKLSSLLLEMIELQKGLLPAIKDSDLPAFSLSGTGGDDAVDLELLVSQIASEMLQLIEALNVEGSGLELARGLIQRIEAGLKATDIPGVMSDLVRLTRLSAGLEHQEFENYLLNLNEQLTFVQQFLAQNHSDQQQSYLVHQQLDQRVRQDVTKLSHSMRESQDLQTLKRAVASQLRSIMQTMDEYRQREDERESRMQQRYESLLQKVDQMESEAARVKSRMEEEQLRARTDPLTGLPNRSSYDDYLRKELGRWERYGTTFSVAVIDLDLFKMINDRFGHLAGDKVLRLVARVLRQQLRGSDFIARYGGEEFVIVFPSTAVQDARAAADKLREAVISSPFNFKGEPVQVSASIGITQVVVGDDSDQLFARADQALYAAKGQGRNQVVCN